MKLIRVIAAAAALAAAVSMVSCSSGTPSEPSGNPIITYVPQTEPPTAAPTEPVVAAADGPRLSVRDTEAAAGEIAEVTIVIENAELSWNMCGFHITYPNVLKPEMLDAEARLVRKKNGDASEYNVGSTAMEWQDNLPPELADNNLGSIFFTEIFEDDHGLNGDVVTFFLKVPDDAVSGTEYPIDFFYLDGDVFSNKAGDASVEKYVFENWKGGKITVK